MRLSRAFHRRYTPGMDHAAPLVTTDPEILGGKPCFAGTRVPVQMLFDWLARGHTVAYFVDQLPSVRIEQVEAVLGRAAELVGLQASPVEDEPVVA